ALRMAWAAPAISAGVSPRVLKAARIAAISTSTSSPWTIRWKTPNDSFRSRLRSRRTSSTSAVRMVGLGPADHVGDQPAPLGGQDRFRMELDADHRGLAMGYRHDQRPPDRRGT